MAHNQAGQTEDSNCGCAKTEFQNLEPISNGHVYRNPGDQCSIPSLVSNPQLVVPTPVYDSGCKVLDLPCIVKHKLSSITFSDNTCSTGADGHAFANETSEDGESSPEEEDSHDDADDGDDDEVFPELPQSRELHVNSRHRRSCKDKQKRRGAVSARAETEHTVNNNGYEAEGETSNKEVWCYRFKTIHNEMKNPSPLLYNHSLTLII